MDSKRPNSAVFRESDYHTPSPRNKRRRRLLERKSSACMCTCCGVFLVIVIVLSVTIGLRITGDRDSFSFDETLGDTRLVEFSPSYCSGIRLESNSAPATLYLLDEKPPLTGWSNITFDPSFIITKYIEYVESYGWYDYGDVDYAVEIDYVAWNFHLNKGSEIRVEACLDTEFASVTYILIEGKSNYNNWKENYNNYDGQSLPFCSAEHHIMIIDTVNKSNEYYLVFYSPSELEIDPRINMTLSLHRTEYIVDNENNRSCSTGDAKSCTLRVPLNGPRYSLIQTSDKETKDVKFGKKVQIEWTCRSRNWVYVLIFFCPVMFFTSLFIAMYCIVLWFWSRKLKSYQTLQETTSDNHSTCKIVYQHPDEKRSINLVSSSK